jgi:hypothetical protein
MASTPRTTRPIGSNNIKHPIITFRVNLERNREESVGPNTNSRNVHILHPDMHDNSADRGTINATQHDENKSTYLPGFLAGDNIVQINNNTIVAYGQRAMYLRNTYTTGSNPILEVLSIQSASTL